jgi:hypothetical protein
MRTIALLLLTLAATCGVAAADRADLDPWSLLSMKRLEARAHLVSRGYECFDLRAYVEPNAKGMRHLTFLRCEAPLRGGSDCRVVQLDVTEEASGAHGVSFRREPCSAK